MIDPANRDVWLHRVLFVALALVFLFFRLLPMGTTPAESCAPDAGWCRAMDWLAHMPGPDLLLCIIFAWTMRRPDYLPTLLIAAAVLMMQVVIDTNPQWFDTAAERSDARLLALCFILGITSCAPSRADVGTARHRRFCAAARCR